ncbi:MAG: hypothetical protein GTN73_02825 [Candidatus Aminicenantes bacterium]|nr:hypothetical protein [Candidatus Aminicenantes bacterium]
MRIYVFKKKRVITLGLLFISLVLFTRIASPKGIGSFEPKFSIDVKWGPRYISIGDINKNLEAFDSYLSEMTSYEGDKMKRLNNYKKTVEGELRLDASSKFAIGVGIEKISEKNESRFEFTDPFPIHDMDLFHTISTESEVSAVNLKLGTYYTIPLVRRINLILNGGVDYYISKASLYKYHEFQPEFFIWPFEPEEWEYDINARRFGFHGGIGFEYRILGDLSVVLEFQGRYARMENLKGTKIITDEGKEEGILYIGEKKWFDEYWPDLIISPSRPSGDEFRNVREAVLDFSGYSFRLGIKLNFFRSR